MLSADAYVVSSRSRCARRQSQPRWGGKNKASGRHPFLSDASRSRRGTPGLPRSRQAVRAEARLCGKQTHRPPCRREGSPAEARFPERGCARSSGCRSPGDVHSAGSRSLLQEPKREKVGPSHTPQAYTRLSAEQSEIIPILSDPALAQHDAIASGTQHIGYFGACPTTRWVMLNMSNLMGLPLFLTLLWVSGSD